jgi:acyl-CoA thioester hydrolase
MTAISTQARAVEKVFVYFDDFDALGMVYHGRFAALLEHGLTAQTSRMGLELGHEDLNVVVRELAITFEQPLTRIGPVELALWADHVGRTSLTYGFRFQTGETVHAHGHRTVIKLDPATRRPAPWTKSTRVLLTRNLLVADPEDADRAR